MTLANQSALRRDGVTPARLKDAPRYQKILAALRERIAGGAREIALSGGTTPRRAYELLAPHVGEARLWLVDERCVPSDHEDSNARMIREAMGEDVRLQAARGELGPEDAAWLYGREVEAMGGVFDVVVLGLGEAGHTASLFPGHP